MYDDEVGKAGGGGGGRLCISSKLRKGERNGREDLYSTAPLPMETLSAEVGFGDPRLRGPSTASAPYNLCCCGAFSLLFFLYFNNSLTHPSQ